MCSTTDMEFSIIWKGRNEIATIIVGSLIVEWLKLNISRLLPDWLNTEIKGYIKIGKHIRIKGKSNKYILEIQINIIKLVFKQYFYGLLR